MKNDVTTLSNLMWQYRAARVLQVANDLDIFNVISNGPMTAQEISQKCRTKLELTEKLLIACTAMGLLKKQQDRYENTDLAKTFLLPASELYQGNIIAHCAAVWDFWHSLPDEIRLEKSRKGKSAQPHRNFITAMRDVAVIGRAQMMVDNVDLTGRKKLLDVGGGPGTYSIAFAKRYPDLKAVVFDIPETIAITKEFIAREKVQDSVITRQGSWDTDTFGEGNDVVLLSNVLHGPDSKAEMKLKKACDSMVKGALLIVQDFLLNDEKTCPLIAALFNVMVGAFSKSELLGLIKEAGFVNARLVIESQEHGSALITAEKP